MQNNSIFILQSGFGFGQDYWKNLKLLLPGEIIFLENLNEEKKNN